MVKKSFFQVAFWGEKSRNFLFALRAEKFFVRPLVEAVVIGIVREFPLGERGVVRFPADGIGEGFHEIVFHESLVERRKRVLGVFRVLEVGDDFYGLGHHVDQEFHLLCAGGVFLVVVPVPDGILDLGEREGGYYREVLVGGRCELGDVEVAFFLVFTTDQVLGDIV